MSKEQPAHIGELLKKRLKAVSKEEKALFEDFYKHQNPEQVGELEQVEFEGFKGGVGKFTSDSYTSTYDSIGSILEKNTNAKEKLNKEDLEATALEELVINRGKLLKKNKKVQQHVSTYETYKKQDAHTSHEDRIDHLTQIAEEVFGFNLRQKPKNKEEENLQLMFEIYKEGVVQGDTKTYASALEQITNHARQSMIQHRAQTKGNEIANDADLSRKAQAYFAHKDMETNKYTFEDAKEFTGRSFIEHAKEIYENKKILAEGSAEEKLKKKGRVYTGNKK